MRRTLLFWSLFLGLSATSLPALASDSVPPIDKLRVTILSTMVVDYVGDNEAIGEWGFAALVEADGRKILFDTGAHPETVLHNAKALGIDLSDVTDVVLSHFHADHTSELVALRQELRKRNPQAMERAHVGPGFFWLRREDGKTDDRPTRMGAAYRALGGQFVEHSQAEQLFPGIWVTGGVPRHTNERNFGMGSEVQRPDGTWVEDDVPDDMSLVIITSHGPALVVGCGHAGIINTLMAVSKTVSPSPVDAVIGGLHLFESTDEHVDWTAQQMRHFGVRHLIEAHCTGIEALARLRTGIGLNRRTAIQGAIGTSYTLDQEINPGPGSLVR